MLARVEVSSMYSTKLRLCLPIHLPLFPKRRQCQKSADPVANVKQNDENGHDRPSRLTAKGVVDPARGAAHTEHEESPNMIPSPSAVLLFGEIGHFDGLPAKTPPNAAGRVDVQRPGQVRSPPAAALVHG